MNIHPNETRVRAIVKSVDASPDGYGHNVELEILGNDSHDPKADYLKVKPGDRVSVFAADIGSIQRDSRIVAKLGLSGGPFGQRTVLREAERLPVNS